MITVGVTGGIGSGKTTVCEIWEKLGAKVIYADDLAKELMQTDERLKKRLVEAFGDNTYLEDRSLNKPHLIKEAFEKHRVEELNDIVHPILREKIKELILFHEQEGVDVFVVEAAVLLNKGRPDYVEKIVLVTSDKKNRVERVIKRDKSTEQEIIARLNKQPDFEKASHLVDQIIVNNGTLDDLSDAATKLYKRLIKKRD
ncbi:MAG: dephospho-CoA kinase [Balneolaceae bacterium]